MALTVPTRCSLRRGKALTGLGRKALEPLMTEDGRGLRSLPVADLERLIGKPVDISMWDAATLRISHEALEDAAA